MCVRDKAMCLIRACECLFKFLFCGLSCITCQYVRDVKTQDDEDSKSNKCYKVCCSILFISYMVILTFCIGLSINLFPTVLFTIDWYLCPINYYNICYTLEFHSSDPNSSKVPTIVLRSEDDDDGKIFNSSWYSKNIYTL